MSATEKLNLTGWGWLTEVIAWSLIGFWQMFLLLFTISVVLGELARVYEYIVWDIPYFRPRFSGYLIGDVALSVAGGLAVASVHQFDGSRSLYNRPVFYLGVLCCSVVVALAFEWSSVRSNQKNPLVGFTWGQERLPSKWVHTLAFGPMLAILFCLAIHVVMNPIGIAQVVAIMGLVAFWYALDSYVDAKRVDPRPDPNSLPEEWTNKVWLFVKAHPHPSRNRQIDEWREQRRAELSAAA